MKKKIQKKPWKVIAHGFLGQPSIGGHLHGPSFIRAFFLSGLGKATHTRFKSTVSLFRKLLIHATIPQFRWWCYFFEEQGLCQYRDVQPILFLHRKYRAKGGKLY